MNTSIKRCTLDDLSELIEIGSTTFYETFKDQNSEDAMQDYLSTAFNVTKITEELKTPESQFYILNVHDTTAGYLKVNVGQAQSEALGEDTLEVERIYILAAFQKYGFGKLLMEKAISVAKELGKHAIWLGVWEKNQNAISFYEKTGFKKCGSHSFYMGDEEQIDYIMKLGIK